MAGMFESGELSELREIFGSSSAKKKTTKRTSLKSAARSGPESPISLQSDRGGPKTPLEGNAQVRRPRIASVEDLEGVEEPEKWTFSSSAQSLSTALNNPSYREIDLFTRTWGSGFTPVAPIPPSNLPPISLADFKCYLRDTNAGRKIHRAIARQISREKSEAGAKSPSKIEDFRPWTTHVQQDGRSYSLDTVPKIFYLPDFSLADDKIFQEVLPLARLFPKKRLSPKIRVEENGVEGPLQGDRLHLRQGKRESGRSTSPGMLGVVLDEGVESGMRAGSGEEGSGHHSMKLLHEKLTHYLDVVEVHLAYQISQRADVFFNTLSSQQELETFIMMVRQDVMELRHKLRTLDADSTHTALRLFSHCRRKQRLKAVHDKIRLIATVQQTQPTIQLLLKNSDFVGALDLILTTQDVLQQELHGIHALRHLGSQLSEIESVICRMMESDMVEFAMQDIKARLEQALEDTSTQQAPLEAEDRLGSVVLGLLRQEKLHFLPSLREALLVFLRAKIKGILAGYLQQEMGGASGAEPPSLADCMRNMNFQDWLELLQELFTRVLHLQKAIKDCVGVIRAVCMKASGLNDNSSTSVPATPMSTSTAPPTSTFSATPIIDGSKDSIFVNYSGDEMFSNTSDGVGMGSLKRGVVSNNGGMGEMQRLETQTSLIGGGVADMGVAYDDGTDMLDQLAMDEELSDARLGGVADQNMGVVMSQDLTISSGDRSPSVEMSDGWGEGVATEDKSVSGASHMTKTEDLVKGCNGELTRGTGMELTREVESTVDRTEQQRVDSHIRPARCGFISAQESARLLRECDQVVSASCDLVHAQCGKVLTLRAKAGLLSNLPAHDFLSLIHAVETFVRSSASLTDHHCPQLRVALLAQARTFLDQYHDTSRKNLSLLLENERWCQCEVPMEVQALVHRLETGAGLQLPQATPTATTPMSQPPAKYLVIHGANFAVLSTVLLLVKRLLEYSSYADSLPMLINEIMTKLIDIIKYFNVRTRDLVLGAGAMNSNSSVGLKNITARHLAIMLRCLQAVALLVPDLKIYFQNRLTKQQHVLLTQFDTVTMDLAHHCDGLQGKLQTIMDEAINKALSKWDAKPPVPSTCFRNISKKIAKLHENVEDILPPQQVELLFAGIEVCFRARLKEHLRRLAIRNDGSSRHGLVNRELHHLEGAIGSMDNVSAFGSSLFDVWTE